MMKIRLTEEQYRRLLIEDKDYGRLGEKVQQYMVNMFELLDKRIQTPAIESEDNKDEIIDIIKSHLGLNDHEANIVYYNYINKWLNRSGNIVGEPLDFVATYTIRTIMPTVVSARTYLPGFVEVTASSSEDALDKVLNGEYNTMYLDENSFEFDNPDLDYDMYGDADIMEDMVIDHVGDIDWEDTEEIEDRIKIKK